MLQRGPIVFRSGRSCCSWTGSACSWRPRCCCWRTAGDASSRSRYMAGEEGEEKYYALLPAMIGDDDRPGLRAAICSTCGSGSRPWRSPLTCWSRSTAIRPARWKRAVKYLVQSALGLGAGPARDRAGLAPDRHARPGRDPAALAGSGRRSCLAAGALFVIGFGVKIALVPMHTWLPDAHSQAPSGISAMLSGVVIEAGLVALLRALGRLQSVLGLGGPAAGLWPRSTCCTAT